MNAFAYALSKQVIDYEMHQTRAQCAQTKFDINHVVVVRILMAKSHTNSGAQLAPVLHYLQADKTLLDVQHSHNPTTFMLCTQRSTSNSYTLNKIIEEMRVFAAV